MAVPLKEVGFGLDTLGRPLVYTSVESLSQIFYNVFMMVPGTLPSLPRVGINIKKYLYNMEGQINTEELRDSVFYSCEKLLSFIQVSDVNIQEVEQTNGTTLVVLVTCTIDDEQFALISALRKGSDGDVAYAFKSQSMLAA